MTGIYLEWLKLKKLSHLYEQQCTCEVLVFSV